jgi:Acyclic terpene utilisation family protein AtuA
MSTIHLEDLGDDRVRVTGATGRARPDQLKVVAGYSDGFKAEVTWGYSWPDAYAKSQAALAMVKTQLTERRVRHDELFVEYPGLNSAHGALAPLPTAMAELNEVWMRMVLRTQSKTAAEGFGRLFPWMGLSGPAYTCGFNGLRSTGELLGIWPTLISREVVEAQVRIEWVEVGADS